MMTKKAISENVKRFVATLAFILVSVLVIVAVDAGINMMERRHIGKLMSEAYSEATQLEPELSAKATGLYLWDVEQEGIPFSMRFSGHWGVVLDDGTVVLEQCQYNDIAFGSDGIPTDMVQTPMKSIAYVIRGVELPDAWRQGTISVLPSQDGINYFIAVGVPIGGREYVSQLWHWSLQDRTYGLVDPERMELPQSDDSLNANM